MEIWYFETSAINDFMEGHTVEDALATKQYQLNKGRDWRLSSTTLWEILMTPDVKRREQLLYFCQHLFSRELLPSPTELIIAYIDQGMPKVETPRTLVSKTPMSDTWRDLVDDRRRTFSIDRDELKHRVDIKRGVSKEINKLIRNGDRLIDPNSSFAGADFSLSSLVRQLPIPDSKGKLSKIELLSLKVSLYYILLILCAEADLDNMPIKEFWEKKGIDSTLDRISYVVKELPLLVYQGPFFLMAGMTIQQANRTHSRGVWFDSLHSIYLTYVDMFCTGDAHFKELRDIIPEPVLRRKVHHMSEIKISHHPVDAFGVQHT